VDRRSFLRWAAAAIAAGTVLDPERLLWVPGAKTIFLPDPTIVEAATMAEALRAGLCARLPDGHGGWCDMELRLNGPHLDARLRAEIAAIRAMGGYVVARRTYNAVTLT
jgi:hypothetical protein